ncbi:TIR domain-containing protein [Desulfosarcina widdelii]|uniref:TIR domain-containing protein n=1 Tax=Desulfosarcina widdelii TaxID=947919 RepID=UPI0012D2CEF0|nr:TIR domain-containing protein [Desulfosarcina widdelii]
MGYHPSSQLGLGGLFPYVEPIKRKVFISYHHKNDQSWYNHLSFVYSNDFDLFYDNSVERKIDSTNSEYLNRKIREEYIFGTSVTIVLCGSETWKRRWVDWEIHATLHHGHGLLGIALPSCAKNYEGKNIVPDRLYKNLVSGFANFMVWDGNPDTLKANIEAAAQNSSRKSLIDNNDIKMKRSSS